ncbi:MAG: hypothetical protein ACRDO8_00785 [Nocardioidaceae bacterium]
MRWRPTSSVPREVQDELPLAAGERVLAGARETGGRWHAGSDAALYVATDDGYQRLPWETVEWAAWERESNELTVVEVADYGEQQARRVLTIEEPGRFLELVRERVTASVLLRRPVPVPGRHKRWVTVVARRSPTRTGDVTYSFVLDRGLDPEDRSVRDAARTGLVHVRDELGM